MRRLIAGLVALSLALSIAAPAAAARPVPVTASITVNETGPYAIGDAVTFTVAVPKLHGSEYPMVYLACRVDGRTVYGQLDHPIVTFVLGGGSSPWIDPTDPGYRAPATCTGYLYAYSNPFGPQSITLLATTLTFPAG